MTVNHEKPKKITVWLLACRPKTLPAAAAPVILASAAACYEGVFQAWIALITLASAILMQIGANFANDVFDYHRGADTVDRLGPVRVTQAQLLTPREMYAGMIIVFGGASVLGLYLITQSGWPILVIGVLAILAALAYSGGPLPYGYIGLGELFVFLFFGPAAVWGTYYAQAGRLSELAIWGSIPMGLLVTAILVVNNLRDVQTDRKAGKMTLAARFGEQFTRWEFVFLILCSFLVPIIMVLFRNYSPWILTSMFAAIKLPKLLDLIWNYQGRALNKALADTGQLVLVFAMLFAIGLILA